MRAREAARTALDDVDPADLRATIDDRLADASMTPAALTFVCARAVDESLDTATPGVVERAVGVQLVYEGLRLTRTLVATEPWADGVDGDLPADLEILAADVLVSRGFALLATTEASGRAVEMIRAFGRDQTARDEEFQRELEGDACTLAAWAGTTVGGGPPSDALLGHLDAFGRGFDASFPAVARALDTTARERIAAVATGERAPDRDATDRRARSTGDS